MTWKDGFLVMLRAKASRALNKAVEKIHNLPWFRRETPGLR